MAAIKTDIRLIDGDIASAFKAIKEYLPNVGYEIILHEKKLADSMPSETPAIGHHHSVRESFHEFVGDFEMLKKNFKRFVAHND